MIFFPADDLLNIQLNLFEFSDEDFESAVKALNGNLYPDPPQAAASDNGTIVFIHDN